MAIPARGTPKTQLLKYQVVAFLFFLFFAFFLPFSRNVWLNAKNRLFCIFSGQESSTPKDEVSARAAQYNVCSKNLS